jgi:hypothetical protein
VLLVLTVGLLAVGAYAALVWYPLREAEEAMAPASRDFAAALEPLERTVDAFPENGDPALLAEAADVLGFADDARARLTEAQIRLEDEAPPNMPIVSQRGALRIARETHQGMQEFHVAALELVGRLEVASRYLTQLAPTLTTVDNLETALGDPDTPAEIEGAVASGTPIVEQLLADLRALSPPDEVGPVHASLTAIARGIRSGVEDLGELTGEAEAAVALPMTRHRSLRHH